jgi:hypothetical protein
MIVNNLAADFGPRVAVERHLVHTDDHLRRKSQTSQLGGQHAGTLQT